MPTEEEVEDLLDELAPQTSDWLEFYDSLLPELEDAVERANPEESSAAALGFTKDRVAEMIGMRVDPQTGGLRPNPNAEYRIDDATREMLRDLILKTDPEDLSDAIMDSTAFSEARAELIAETELKMVIEGSQYAAARASGKDYLKQSITTSEEPCEDCVENEEAGKLGMDDQYPSGHLLPPFHPGCQCDQEYVEPDEVELEEMAKAWDESLHPRVPSGQPGGGEFAPSGVNLKGAKEKALENRHSVQTHWIHEFTGGVGEKIALEYIQKELGYKDAETYHVKTKAEGVTGKASEATALDLIADHEAFEVKTGIADSSSPRWRVTLGQPGGKLKELMSKMDPTELAKFNRQRVADAMQRKTDALKRVSQALGHPVKPMTIGIIVHPDKWLADVHIWSGFHEEIRWKSEFGKSGYVGSFHYQPK